MTGSEDAAEGMPDAVPLALDDEGGALLSEVQTHFFCFLLSTLYRDLYDEEEEGADDEEEDVDGS